MKNRKFKEYEYWRLAVYERDNYTCQCCGDSKGGNLNAHHLDSHDWAKDKRLDLDNAITLCVNCHTDFHMTYGYGNNTKEQFEEYMNVI
jgi:5-methylcytosine-specific restriction endonuclease McrA